MVLKKKENVSIKDKSELDGFFLPSIVLFIHLAVKQSDAIILPPKKNHWIIYLLMIVQIILSANDSRGKF